MANLRIRSASKVATTCGSSFPSWLKRQHFELREEASALKELAFLSKLTIGQPIFMTTVPKGDPLGLPKVFDEKHVSAAAIGIWEKWHDYYLKQMYEVIVQNDALDPLETLTITFKRFTIMNNTPVYTGPFQKTLGTTPLNNGQKVGFELCPCLEMASDYLISFVFQGQQQKFPQNIDTLNLQELKDFNDIDFCGDSLVIEPTP